jgi:hypothetical protein
MEASTFYKEIHANEFSNSLFYDFWRCVTICHDVIIFKYDGKDHYSGRSQDEIVLLEAGKSSGLAVLTERDSDGVTTRLNNVDEKY